MRSLYEIEVSVNNLDEEDHVEITVEPAFSCDNADDFGPPTKEDAAAALTDLAGIVSRVGLALQGWVWLERREHGCRGWLNDDAVPPYWSDACTISSPEEEILRPSRSWDSRPALWITVPKKRTKRWLDLISDALRQISEDQP